MSDPLRIVIGYDRQEVPAFHTLCNSILERSSRPVQITPLYLPMLETDGLMWRKDKGSTDFAFSRFLAPYMVGYRGNVLFLDCDMVVLGDVAELFECIESCYSVAVCKHDYTPKAGTKFGGNVQTAYPCKLWSAVMLFNCASQKVKNLTPRAVNEMSGADLHQFAWAGGDLRIGEIPEEWHWLPNHSAGKAEDAKLIHFTEWGPWHEGYPDKGSVPERIWLQEHAKIISRGVL
jgi:hypothetical protein